MLTSNAKSYIVLHVLVPNEFILVLLALALPGEVRL